MKYSVIYVNYYSLSWIKQSIKSLELHHKLNNVECIIASNSPWGVDHVESFIDTSIPLKTILLKDNPGFARANNIAAGLASGEFLFFLNPDTTVKNDVLEIFSEFWGSRHNPGVLGPKTHNEDGSVQHSVKRFYDGRTSIGVMFPGLSTILPKIFGHPYKPPSLSKIVDVINGSAMFTTASTFEKLRGFNESLFLYWEEDDFCKKVKSAGLETWFLSEAEIIHLEGKSITPINEKLILSYHKSKIIYFREHNPGLVFKDCIASIIGYGLRSVFYFLVLKKEKSSVNGVITRYYLSIITGSV